MARRSTPNRKRSLAAKKGWEKRRAKNIVKDAARLIPGVGTAMAASDIAKNASKLIKKNSARTARKRHRKR